MSEFESVSRSASRIRCDSNVFFWYLQGLHRMSLLSGLYKKKTTRSQNRMQHEVPPSVKLGSKSVTRYLGKYPRRFTHIQVICPTLSWDGVNCNTIWPIDNNLIHRIDPLSFLGGMNVIHAADASGSLSLPGFARVCCRSDAGHLLYIIIPITININAVCRSPSVMWNILVRQSGNFFQEHSTHI